jgi:hypothetical protein
LIFSTAKNWKDFSLHSAKSVCTHHLILLSKNELLAQAGHALEAFLMKNNVCSGFGNSPAYKQPVSQKML